MSVDETKWNWIQRNKQTNKIYGKTHWTQSYANFLLVFLFLFFSRRFMGLPVNVCGSFFRWKTCASNNFYWFLWTKGTKKKWWKQSIRMSNSLSSLFSLATDVNTQNTHSNTEMNEMQWKFVNRTCNTIKLFVLRDERRLYGPECFENEMIGLTHRDR